MHRTNELRHYPTRSQERALLHRFGCTRWMRNCGHEPRLDAYRRDCPTLSSVKLSRIPTCIDPALSWLAEVPSSCNVFARRARVTAHLSGTPAQPPLSHEVPSSHCGSHRVIRGPRP